LSYLRYIVGELGLKRVSDELFHYLYRLTFDISNRTGLYESRMSCGQSILRACVTCTEFNICIIAFSEESVIFEEGCFLGRPRIGVFLEQIYRSCH